MSPAPGAYSKRTRRFVVCGARAHGWCVHAVAGTAKGRYVSLLARPGRGAVKIGTESLWTMKQLCEHAVDAAMQTGVRYADARVVVIREQRISTEDERVSGIHNAESVGIGVRVICDGAWGFAATSELTRDGVERAARDAVAVARAGTLAPAPNGVAWAEEDSYRDVYLGPCEKDPFTVPLGSKIDLLLAINRATNAVPGVSKCHSGMRFRRFHRFLTNSEGTSIESDVVATTASYTATAVNDETSKTRSFAATARNAGYEHVESTPLLAEAPRVGEEAVQKLTAKPCPVGRRDLILHPSHLALTMHESIGHATELDRALGMEESLAGSSFATPDLLGTLRYGSELMTITCDNTMPEGLATHGYDDDGVKAQKWDLIRDGLFVDYQTNRETCHTIGAQRSHGGNRADSWSSIPILRQSNFGLAPGSQPLTPEELIADTREGIYIDGMGSFSIDQKRHNFQFGGDCFWEIRNGKLGAMLRDVTYQAITTEFWEALDAVCDARYWAAYGVMNCGKGDPGQVAQMSHASAPARFRGIRVGDAPC